MMAAKLPYYTLWRLQKTYSNYHVNQHLNCITSHLLCSAFMGKHIYIMRWAQSHIQEYVGYCSPTVYTLQCSYFHADAPFTTSSLPFLFSLQVICVNNPQMEDSIYAVRKAHNIQSILMIICSIFLVKISLMLLFMPAWCGSNFLNITELSEQKVKCCENGLVFEKSLF